jgi:hypothetical protein
MSNAAPPWEGDGPIVGRWLSTAVALVTRPEASYAAMSPDRPAGPALAYAALGLGVSMMAGLAPWVLYVMAAQRAVPFTEAGGLLIGLGAGPVAWLVFLTVLTILSHTLLLVSGGASGGFRQTVRAVAYGFGSAAPLLIVPYCSVLLVTIAGTTSATFGLAALHRIGPGRAVFALLVPMFLGLALVMVLLFVGLSRMRL